MEEQNENNEALPSAVEYPARFTALDGLFGWIQGSILRSRLYGSGVARIETYELILRAWRRTWLGVPLEAEVRIDLRRIRNVVIDNRWIRFEADPPEASSRRFQFRAASDEAAAAILEYLPKTRSEGFDAAWQELRAFDQALALNTRRAWATAILVGLNILVFAACVIAGGRFWMLDPALLGRWGANLGILVMEGQWFRVVTAFFLHAGLLHLVLNMWVLWGAGKLAERLYGTVPFVVIYVCSGILASLGSIAWNPFTLSVGASGAIFAILGALLVFLMLDKTRVPRKIVRAHALSTAAFVLFNLGSGMLSQNIDNAAHVAGLIAGCVLGWTLARPLSSESRVPLSPVQIAAASAVACIALAAGAWQVHALRSSQPPVGRYWAAHQWLVTGQAEAIRAAAQLQMRANTGTISEHDLIEGLERDVLAFWRDADTRLLDEAPSDDPEVQKFAAMVAEFVKLRRSAVLGLTEGIKTQDENRVSDGQFYARSADEALAKITRLELRAQADRFRSLSRSGFVKAIRDSITGLSWKCAPPVNAGHSAAWDAASRDGMAGRIAGGCAAQRAFETGSYALLDTMLHPPAGNLADMDDGGSRLAGVLGGLDDLFRQRQTVDSALARLSDWRRQLPDSEGPDLIEALMFRTWAWAARGSGTATTVAPNSWVFFSQRIEMAQAALIDADRGPASSAMWYQLALQLGVDASLRRTELRATFDDATAKYPDFYPLHAAMLRELMPRWHGSYAEVDDFIEEMTERASQDRGSELYARLYSIFADLEGDDTDLFKDTQARWPQMKQGYQDLVSRYPRSESLRNAYAAFACRAGDLETYAATRSHIKTPLMSAWTRKHSPETCDKLL